jgi:hypothetical protein
MKMKSRQIKIIRPGALHAVERETNEFLASVSAEEVLAVAVAPVAYGSETLAMAVITVLAETEE